MKSAAGRTTIPARSARRAFSWFSLAPQSSLADTSRNRNDPLRAATDGTGMSANLAIPGYDLLKSLGGGPFAVVFSGRDWSTDDPVAVKVLRPEAADDATAVKLLQREARAGLTVRHPHLVRFLDAHVTAPPYFLVMELIEGESLRERLSREYRLDLRTAIWVARQVAEALAALHRANFFHADVKPENVVLTTTGTTKLIDLGFAHKPGENAALLRDGFILGTANYIAPELCAGEPADDPRADLFSFGVMLFEMLTGELPYPAGAVRETMTRHLEEAPTELRDYGGPWPMGLSELVAALLSRKPQERPRASALVQELMRLEITTLQRRRAG